MEKALSICRPTMRHPVLDYCSLTSLSSYTRSVAKFTGNLVYRFHEGCEYFFLVVRNFCGLLCSSIGRKLTLDFEEFVGGKIIWCHTDAIISFFLFDWFTGFAFIYMEDERDAEDAIRALDQREFGRKGRRLRVEWTKVMFIDMAQLRMDSFLSIPLWNIIYCIFKLYFGQSFVCFAARTWD